MPRDLPVGNGSLLINFDAVYQLRDVYYPHVGQESHTEGHPFRFGVWVDGEFRWVHGEGWQRSLGYVEDTLVTQVDLTHPELKLRLECQDVVDFHENLYLRKVDVHNLAGGPREVRLFFCHDFHIYDNEVGDTAYYEPERRALFHYKRERWFMINGLHEGDVEGVDQWATGIKETGTSVGTWRDAEDGELGGNPIAQGAVDSCIALHTTVPGQASSTLYYWIAVGYDFEEVTRLNRIVRAKGPETFLQRTAGYWRLWVNKEAVDFGDMPQELIDLYKRSLLILRTQIDNGGAILAANDHDTTAFNRDTYSYMWPRDGALVADSLIAAGYPEVSQRFFNFCRDLITKEGYFLHKYNPDGSLASSWHPWLRQGEKHLPIQEDETGLVLWALWRHFERYREIELLKPLFRPLVVRAAEFMADYRDEATGLPRESHDLWEERVGVFAWTTAAVFGGLMAAANFAEAFGEGVLAQHFEQAAEDIRRAADEHLWREDLGRFVRGVYLREGEAAADPVQDASMCGLWMFGMYAPDDPRIVATMEAMRERLWVKTEVGGLARYENDYYHQVSQDIENVPGNPWFITTLWLAEWHIATAREEDDLAASLELLQWVEKHALASGVLAEQIHPHTNEPLSVSPLTWSHATLVTAMQHYMGKRAALSGSSVRR